MAISVRTFVDRYDELVAGNEKYGAEARAAQELLTRRGVTVAVVDEAKAMLTKLTLVAEPAESISAEEQGAELEAAEAAMWAWYLEWSKIARIAVKQRVLLRQLGFLSIKRGGDEEEEVDAPAAPTTSAAPATTRATTALAIAAPTTTPAN